jgi:hypothetical protein
MYTFAPVWNIFTAFNDMCYIIYLGMLHLWLYVQMDQESPINAGSGLPPEV